MATCAAVVGADVPNDAAEDSFNFLPVLLGEQGEEPVRQDTLHQTISLALAIRRGPWKYLDHKGSGGNRYDRGVLQQYALPEKAPEAPGQLYNLEEDPGETANLYFDRPEIVKELKTKLDEYKQSGRSAPRPGPRTPAAADDGRPRRRAGGRRRARSSGGVAESPRSRGESSPGARRREPVKTAHRQK